MATFVGKQADFLKAMKELLELEYDALEAYKVAVEKVEDARYRAKLQQFKSDHEKHIVRLSALMRAHTDDVPKGPCGKQWLTKGKVFLADLISDKAILAAMVSNEMDTNTAYKTMNERIDKWSDASEFLKEALVDEMLHKSTLEDFIEASD